MICSSVTPGNFRLILLPVAASFPTGMPKSPQTLEAICSAGVPSKRYQPSFWARYQPRSMEVISPRTLWLSVVTDWSGPV